MPETKIVRYALDTLMAKAHEARKSIASNDLDDDSSIALIQHAMKIVQSRIGVLEEAKDTQDEDIRQLKLARDRHQLLIESLIGAGIMTNEEVEGVKDRIVALERLEQMLGSMDHEDLKHLDEQLGQMKSRRARLESASGDEPK